MLEPDIEAARRGEERILVVAPVGRDAELACHVLREAEMQAEVCADIAEMCRELANGAGVVLLTQEALTPEPMACLLSALDSQPPWSDVPVVILVSKESQVNNHLTRLLGERANATFLERPTGAATLVRAVAMGLRARRRQYQLRDHLLALSRAREAEKQARAEAEEAVRIRDEFLASVAHDLKNPLGAIKGTVQLLQRQVTRSGNLEVAKVLRHLGRIESVAGRAVAQIDELLDVARLQTGQPLPLVLAVTDLVSLTQRVAGDWQETTTSHRIRVEAPAQELLGVWDPQRLERVLANLLGNAIKYSPDGGEITLRLGQEGDVVALCVRDHGIGIPAPDLSHVFERFYRAGNAAVFSGTGLGLSGVRQIVEQHGGTIAIDSIEGRGTSVTVRLPLTRDQVVERRMARGRTSEPMRAVPDQKAATSG